MKLIDALKIANRQAAPDARPFSVFLACGFTPLHFQTMLKAHLQLALPNHAISLTTGQYGSFLKTLQTLCTETVDYGIVVLEWPDVDPRLGLRHLGGWTSNVLDDILFVADRRLHAVLEILKAVKSPIALALPSLPAPPAACSVTVEASRFDLDLQRLVANFAAELADSVVVLKSTELDRISSLPQRHDLSSELLTGFPYSIGHADALATLLSRIVVPRSPKKGLVTDLDDTLWRGIVGEDGVDGVSWDLDHRSQMHGAYQQLLRSLSDSGVLVAIASKNDPARVDEVFGRDDLLVRREDFYPVEVHWEPKSSSVKRILEKWNIGAGDVVFVDDAPMELDEVKDLHAGIECVLFPKDDPAAIYDLIHNLRDLFGKRQIREEDRIRASSIRNAQTSQLDVRGRESFDAFLEDARQQLTFSYKKEPLDPRILELINKTNQFNLNGGRYLEQEWQAYASAPDSLILSVKYEDKYGPFGKIAALGGRLEGATLVVDTWVMSCRAFSRRIEHQTIRELFDRFNLDRIVLHFAETDRNGPMTEFLRSVQALFSPDQPPVITASKFQEIFPSRAVQTL